jgi:hypothetical protein
VGFDDADDNIVAVFTPGTGLQKHFISLADARRGTDENAQFAGAAFFAPRRFKKRFR